MSGKGESGERSNEPRRRDGSDKVSIEKATARERRKQDTAAADDEDAERAVVPGAQARFGEGRLADLKVADAANRRATAKGAAKKAENIRLVEGAGTIRPDDADPELFLDERMDPTDVAGEISTTTTALRSEHAPAELVHASDHTGSTFASGTRTIRAEVGYVSGHGSPVTGGGPSFSYSVTLADRDSQSERDGSSVPGFVDGAAAVAKAVSPEDIEREGAEMRRIPEAREYQQPEALPFRKTKRGRAFLAAGACLVVAAAVGASVGATVGGNNGDGGAGGLAPTPEPTPEPTPTPPPTQEYLIEHIGTQVNDVGTPYHDALDWIEKEDPMNLTTQDDNLVQRYLLAVLYFSTVQDGGSGWAHCGASDPPSSGNSSCEAVIDDKDVESVTYSTRVGSFDSIRWLSGVNECEWMGIICGDGDHISDITLVENNLEGTLVQELYRLSVLQGIILNRNALLGTIPSEYGQMSHLLQLRINSNRLTRNIPLELYNIKELSLRNNSLTGNLPAPPPGSLIQYLDVGMNGLSGEIPREFGELESLEGLLLDQNDLVGTMPEEVCNLTSGNLEELEVDCAEVNCRPDCCTNCQARRFE